MCGIAGILSPRPVEPALLRAMAARIAHRGPDDDGVWSDPDCGIGLAHRRLAIVDLSPHGHQPMASADGRWVLSFNGEIYNHPALRTQMERAGAVPEGGWRGQSDTETLIEGIARWGLEATLREAVGMFAFALWDRRERTLQLVRDRFGEKPLYYGWAGRNLVFASELKAIRAHAGFVAEVDRGALSDFTRRTYVPAPRSIYRGLFKLIPGCVLTVVPGSAPRTEAPLEGATVDGVTLTRYWSYRAVVEAGLAEPFTDEHDARHAIEAALSEAIRGQAVADVPVGAFLSGGIDSSTVVALYQKHHAVPVRTFSIGFEEAAFDEAPHARAVAAALGTEHREQIVTVREARDVIPLLPAMYDEPFADSSQIPTYLVSKFARGEVTVALTGDGGDELFGGYNRHVMGPPLWRAMRAVPGPLRRGAAGLLGRIPGRAWEHVAGLGGRAHVAARVHKVLRIAAQARGFEDVAASFLDEWRLGPSPVLGAAGHDSAFDLAVADAPDAVRMMYGDAVAYLPDDILAKVDRASMAVSLEMRVPFLDHRLAAVAARVPLAMKMRGGHGKHILREVLFDQAPRGLFDRPKAGFAVPVGEWLRGPLRSWAEDLLDEGAMRQAGWFDPAMVQRRWQDHVSGRADATPAIWAILMFEAWRRENGV